jgi:hypothetical protein
MRSPKRALVIVAITALVGCSAPRVPATTPTTAGDPPPLRLYATTAALPLLNDISDTYAGGERIFETRSGSFQTLFTRLLEGETAYLLTNYMPANTPLWAAPVAQDGIAVIVHPDAGIDGLTLDQLRDLMQGRITNWQALGGRDLPVALISREDGSGTRAEFEQQVMGPRRTTLAARIASSSAQMIDVVAATPGALGYVSQAQVTSQVQTLALDGVLPSRETIADSRYPLRTMIFVAGLAEPDDDGYRRLIGWLQSPAGQSVVARHYVPLVVLPEVTP